MRYFDFLRTATWNPEFSWVETARDSAHQINSFHEDYPARVEDTLAMMLAYSVAVRIFGVYPFTIPSKVLLDVHSEIFQDTNHAGRWRNCGVIIGTHRPPDYRLVPKYMEELETKSEIRTIEDLTDWYSDLETCHPFQDGNGRVGGVIVAVVSKAFEHKKGWLTALQ